MKTILVTFDLYDVRYTNEIRAYTATKYAFRTEEELSVGEVLIFKKSENKMIVTDIIDEDYKYFNRSTGELSNSITNSNCYEIKTLVLCPRLLDEIVYASKVNL